MESRIRELQELINRYGSFMDRHDEQFADSEVHKACKPRMQLIIEKWQAELKELLKQPAP